MLKENKSFQFLVGCFVLFLAYKLYTVGFFTWVFEDPETEGYQNVQILPLVITAAVSAIQMVGVVAIMIVGGLTPLIENLVDNVKKNIPKFTKKEISAAPELDVSKLTNVLSDLEERLANLEGGKSDD
tara:strand:- start:28169 stop:28552 length:384 start_codon:yes stop_codon:yes gene_type:complete